MNVCQVVVSSGWGGAETVAYGLSKHLRDKGHRVSLMLNQEMLKYYADLEGVVFYNIGPLLNPLSLVKAIVSPKERPSEQWQPHNRATSLTYQYSNELLTSIYYKRVRNRLERFLSENHMHIIHAHLEPAVVLASTLKGGHTARVSTLHGEIDLRGMSHVHSAVRPLLAWRHRRFKKALNRMDMLTHVSHFFMSDAFRHWGENLRDKSVVIPNGINLSEFQSSQKSVMEPKGDFNILYPGGAKPTKGGDLVAEAFVKVAQQARDVHLYVALEVPPGHVLRKMVSDAGLEQRVTFVGRLTAPQYRSLLGSVDMLVMPSTQESFGIVYVEAMALGKPIVATNVGGIPEVVKDGRNGILVDLDAGQVAQAILQLYRSSDLRQEMAQNNFTDAAAFDWDGIVDRYVEVYEEASKRKALAS